eukprot:scaffold45930_cov63-Phaeocystis_antarctica.AAC.1
MRDHRVQAVALRRAHLLLRRQPQRAERGGHVALQPRRHALLLAERGAAALGELGRQRRPGGAALLLPQLPLVQLAQFLEPEPALRRAALHKGVAAKERRRGAVGHGEGPRRVGEVLLVEVAQLWRRLPGDRVEQRRRGVAGRRVRPRRVGEVLFVEVAQPRRRLLGDRVEQRRRVVAGRRVRPHRVGEVLRVEVAQLRRRLPGDRVEQRRCGVAGRR